MGAYLSTHLSWTLDDKGRYTLRKSPQNEDSVYRLYYELSREYGQWYGQQDLTFPENNDANSEQALLMTTPFTVPLAFKSQLSLGLLTGSSTHAQQSLFHALVIQKSRTEELAADRDAYIHQGLHRTRLHRRGRLSKRSSVGGEALDPKVCMWACFPDAFWAHYRVAEESAHPTVLLSVARVPLKPDEATRLGAIRKTEAAPAYCVREAADATYQCTVWTLQHAVHHVALLLRLCCPEVSADESLHAPAATLQAEHAVRLGLTRAYLFLDKAECVCPRVPTQRLHTLVTTEVTAMVEALVNDRSSLGAVGVDAAISRAWQHTVLGRSTGGGLGVDSGSPPPPLSPRGAVARKRLSSVRVSDVAAAVSAAAEADPLRAVTSLPLTMLNETLFDPTAVGTPAAAAAAAAASSQPRPSRPAPDSSRSRVGSRQRSLATGGAAASQTPPAGQLSLLGTPLDGSGGRNSSARQHGPSSPLREMPASSPSVALRPGNWDAGGDADASPDDDDDDDDDTPSPAAGTSPMLAPPATPQSPAQASVELKPLAEASPQEVPLSTPPASSLQGGGGGGGGGGDADGAAADGVSGHEASVKAEEAEAEAAEVAARMKPAARPRRERRKTPPSMMELAGDTRGIAPCEITAALVSQHQREALEDVNESERTQDLKRFRDGGGLGAILGGGEAWMTDDLRAEKQQQWREAVLPPTAGDSANMQNANNLLLDSMGGTGGGGGDAAPGTAEGSDDGGGEGRGGTPASTSLQERRRRRRKERHSRDLREWETECRDGSDDEDFRKGTGGGAGWLGGPGTRDLALQLLGATPAKLLAVKASGSTSSVQKSTATASAKIAIDRLSSVQRVVYALLWQQIDVVLMGAQALARRACGPSLTLAAAEEEVERARAICAWLRTVPQPTPPPLVGVEREREMTPWEAAEGDVLSVRVTLSDVAASVKATAEGWAALSCTNNMVPETLTTLPPYARALGEDGVRERGVQASCVYPTLVALLHDLSADFRAVDYAELHAAADTAAAAAAAAAAAGEPPTEPTTPFFPNGEAATAPDHLWAMKRGPASPAMSKASSYSSFCPMRTPEFADGADAPFPRPPGGGPMPADAPAPRRWFRNASVVGGAAAAVLLSSPPAGPERTVTYARRGSRAVKPASQKDAFQDREKRRREVVAALRRHQQSPSQPPTAGDEDEDEDSPSEEGASSVGESPPPHDLSGGVSILQYGPDRVAQPVAAAAAARRRTTRGGRGGARSSKRTPTAAEAAAAQPQAPQSPTTPCVVEELSSEESDARETVSSVIRRDPAAIRNYNTCESDAQLRHAVVSDLLSSGAVEVPPSGSMPSHMTWTHHGSASGFPFIPTPSRHPVGTAGESTIAPQWIQFLQPTTKQARTLFALRSMLDADLSTAANQAALFRGNGFHSLASIVGRRVDYRLRTCAACALLICAQNCAAVKYMYEDVVPKLVATLASQCHDEQPAVAGEQVVLAAQLSRLAAEVAAAPRLRRYEDARTAHARLLAVVSFVLASMALSLQRAKSLMWSLDVRATATALLTACLRDKEDLLRVSLFYLLRSVNYPAPRRPSAAPRVRHMPGLASALVAVLRSPDTAVRELQAAAAVICEYRASAALQAELAAAHAVRHINRALGELSQQLAASALTLGHGNEPCARDTRPQRDTGAPSALPACLRDLASAAPNGLRRRVDMPKGAFLSRCLSYILLLQAFDACMGVREGALQVPESALREYAALHLCLAQRLLKTRGEAPLHGPLVVFADLGDMEGVGGGGSGLALGASADEWDPFAYPLILLATLTGLLASLAGHECAARTALSRDAALVEAMCCLAIVASSPEQDRPVAAPKLQRVVTHVKAGAAAFLKGVAGCRAAAPLLGPHVPRFLAEVGSGDVAVVSASLCSVLEALVREGGVRGAQTRRYVLRQAHLYTVWRAVQSFSPAVRAAAASCLASLVHPGEDHTAETGLPCDAMVEAFLSCLGDRLPILVQFLDPQNPVNDLVDSRRDYLAVQVALCELIANVTHFLNARSLLNTRGLLAVLLRLCKENKSPELLGAASHCLWLVAESMPKEVWEGGALQILADKLCMGNKRADKYIVLTVRVLVDTQSACYQTCIQTGIVSYLVQLLGSSDPVVQASVAASLSTIRRSQQVRATKQRSRSGFLRHLPAH